ncbi:hypothetical protein SBA1_120027 [Candidatus Sulfotelmatobacter kueseliae]|uniref:Uncharacterized protein n=1 Tax=Candidatus Sulfotelmatobacter kueseliae TaxID=2042962 RepID=A0A2U3K1X4_9BACT|nr:hypothetical protein SBA1_120027 [Candidatus Sulfotelmatobacter kueseliae]
MMERSCLSLPASSGRCDPTRGWRGNLGDGEYGGKVERETGIEPATNGLGSRDSTTELLPLGTALAYHCSQG